MFRTKPIAWFFVCFLVIFVALILPWGSDLLPRAPDLRKAYAVFFRATGNTLFGSYSSLASIHFEPLPDGDSERDTKIVFTHRESGTQMPVAVSTRFQGYAPTAFIIALVLSSPLPWSRRWRSLVWCLPAVSAYVALRQFIFIASVIYHPGPLVAKALGFAYWVGVESFAGVFIIPLAIWALVSFRRADFEKVLTQTRCG